MAYQPISKIPCVICGAESIGRKLCRPHYEIAKRNGTLKNYAKLSIDDVFDSKCISMPNGCIEWTGNKGNFGYGTFVLNGKHIRAHRFSYEREFGKIKKGMVILHNCDNPPCVNPNHLKQGTRLENNKDAAQKARMPKGESHWNSKLTKDKIEKIRYLRSSGMSCRQIGRDFGIAHSHISAITRGAYWNK